jgi:hypothetical protein
MKCECTNSPPLWRARPGCPGRLPREVGARPYDCRECWVTAMPPLVPAPSFVSHSDLGACGARRARADRAGVVMLIPAGACQSLSPPPGPSEQKRNIVTSSIDPSRIAGRLFAVGKARCNGVQLCEPCLMIQRRACQPLPRHLIRGRWRRSDVIAGRVLQAGEAITVTWLTGERP